MEQRLESERGTTIRHCCCGDCGRDRDKGIVTKNPCDPCHKSLHRWRLRTSWASLGRFSIYFDLLSFFQLRLELWQVATTPTHFPRMSSLEFAFSGQESDSDQSRHTVRQSLKLNQDHALNVWTVPNS
ncbi:hypothetical protein ACLKA7_016328 [Drosophila subpalustris]